MPLTPRYEIFGENYSEIEVKDEENALKQFDVSEENKIGDIATFHIRASLQV